MLIGKGPAAFVRGGIIVDGTTGGIVAGGPVVVGG